MILRRRGGARAGRAAPCSRAALALLCLAAGAAAAQHRYVFDETVWTRGGWPALKLRFPVENFVEEQAEPAGYELLSSSGTYSQPELQRLQEAGRARRCAHAHPLCTFCVSRRPMWTAYSRLHADRSSPAEWLFYRVQGRGQRHRRSAGRGGERGAGGADAVRDVPRAGGGRVGRGARAGARARPAAAGGRAAAPAAAQLPEPGPRPQALSAQ